MSTPIDKLIQQYSSEAYQLEKYRKQFDRTSRDPVEVDQYELVSGMLSDLRYSLEWMRIGRRPGSRRGAERTDIYRQRELMTELQPVEIGDDEKRRLVLILLGLSSRERTCYLLHFAHGLTYSEIGSILKVSKRSVQEYVNRAKGKVQQEISV